MVVVEEEVVRDGASLEGAELRFWDWAVEDWDWEDGLLMFRDREAGGPTGTMREPNSTPMVTSWWGENRPSQRRMVSWWVWEVSWNW